MLDAYGSRKLMKKSAMKFRPLSKFQLFTKILQKDDYKFMWKKPSSSETLRLSVKWILI